MDTVTPAAVRPAEDVASLLRQAEAEHNAGVACERKTLEHFRRAGEFLIRAKAEAGHGNWLRELAKTRIPQRTAHRYMVLAAGFGKLASEANLGLYEAVAIIKGKPLPPDDDEEGRAAPAPTVTPGYSNAMRNWLDRIRGQLMYFEVDQGGLHKMLERPEMFDWDAVTRELAPTLEEFGTLMIKYARGLKDYAESRSR